MKESDVWNTIAPLWKKYREKPPQEVLDYISGKSGLILDIGCGSGRNFVKQKELLWYGVDFSSEMITQAEKTAKEKEIDAKLSVRDSSNLSSFEDNFFDHVLCNAVLHCVTTGELRDKSISEVYRVLKLGGTAFFSVWSRKSRQLEHKEKETKISWKAGIDSPVERYTYIYDLKEFEEALLRSGFEIEYIKEEGGNIIAQVLKSS